MKKSKFGERRFYGDPSDVKPHPKRPRKTMYDEVSSDLKKMATNPDARKSGFDVRNSDVRVYDKDGKLKKTVKNKALFKQGRRDWETVKRAI